MTKTISPRYEKIGLQHCMGAYRTHYGSERSCSVAGMSAIGIGLLLGGAFSLFAPLLLNILAFWQVAIIPLIALSWIGVGLWMLGTSLLTPRKSVVLFEDGIVCQARKCLEVFHWQEIEFLWKKTTDTAYRYELKRTDGYVFVLESTLTYTKRLGRVLEREVIHHFFALYLSLYQEGVSVQFGPIVVHQEGILVAPHHHLFPWAELKYVDCIGDTLYIRQKQQCEDSACVPVAQVPNACVLEMLIRHIHRIHRENAREHSSRIST